MKSEPFVDYAQYPKLTKKLDFAALVREYRENAGMIKVLKSSNDAIKDTLTPAMIASKVTRVGVDGVPVTLCKGRHTAIDAKRLLEKGVSSDVILFATVTSTYDYLTFGAGKENGDQ